jgi:hypothetical protein
MAVFIKNSPVTSSSCYKTIKTASILITLGTNVDWTMATRGHLKIAKNHNFALIFPIKIDFKVLPLLNGLR